MSAVYFERQLFESAGGDGLACLVAGTGETRDSYSVTAFELGKAGYSTVIYDYRPEVLTKGDPHLMPQLIKDIGHDFHGLVANEKFARHRYIGISLGAFIAANLQFRDPEAEAGIYVTGGVALSHAVWDTVFFRRAKEAFIERGIATTEAALHNFWLPIEMVANRPPQASQGALVVLSSHDSRVNYQAAMRNLTAWQNEGIPIEITTVDYAHNQLLDWSRNNLLDLLAAADDLALGQVTAR